MSVSRELATALICATMASVAQAQSNAGSGAQKTNIILCDTPAHAIAFTVAINDGAPDDIAKDIVGKAAGAEVCDKFIGHASVDEQKTMLDKGSAYIVTSYKFKGVGVMKWSAIPKDR